MSNKLSRSAKAAIEGLLQEGITETPEIQARLEAMSLKAGGQQIAGLVTLHKRRLAGDPGFPENRGNGGGQPIATPLPPGEDHGQGPEAPADPGLPADGFNWGPVNLKDSSGPGGFSFGQLKTEYHISRLAPSNDGFLGVEPQGFTLQKLGEKYGSGVYDVALFINEKKQRVVREPVAATFGPPKFPRQGPGGLPRLIPEGEHLDRPRPSASTSELSDAVRAVKDINEMVGQTGNKSEKLVDKAIDILTKPPQQQDSILSILQAQMQRAELEHKNERDRWEREAKEREAREERERKDAQAKHDRDLERMREEFKLRQEAETRQNEEREKRLEADRKHYMDLEKSREKRLEEAIEATNNSIAGLIAAQKEESEKERAHQHALSQERQKALELERERLRAEMDLQKAHNKEVLELQRQLIPNQGGKTEEIICNTIKDVVTRADAKVTETLEVKKLQEIIKLVGPDNAQQLAAAYLKDGGVDIAKIFGTRREAAQSATPQAPAAQAEGQGAKPAPAGADSQKGDGMNGIAKQMYDSPFFADLLEIWAGHLRLKRTPYLFANQMAGFMMEDRRVELFYNYMAARTWDEFLIEIKPKVQAKHLPQFETPEAVKFFDDVVNLIAQRIEKDHVDRGIVPTAIEETPKAQ